MMWPIGWPRPVMTQASNLRCFILAWLMHDAPSAQVDPLQRVFLESKLTGQRVGCFRPQGVD